MKQLFAALVISVLAGVVAADARAEAELQLYLEGATYDTQTDTWVLTAASDGSSQPIRLWAIGNVSAKGTIWDVKLAVAYDAEYDELYGGGPGGTLPLSLVGSTTGGYGGFTDATTPGDPTLLQHVTDGSVPTLGDGRDLPSHGEYGDGIAWQEFALGDFDQTDSPIADFIGSFPDPTAKMGQINVYEISVLANTGLHGVRLHFDLYDHYEGGNHSKYVFSPFSHDGDGTMSFVPAPPAHVGLIGMALAGLVGHLWRRRRGR